MSGHTPTVAFSTVEPLWGSARVARRRPSLFAAPVLVLLLPLPLLCVLAWSLVTGRAGVPLSLALAGFPPADQLLLQTPTSGDWRAFAALAVVGVAAVTTVVTAALVGGAAGSGRTPRDAVALAVRRWPSMAAVLFVQFLALAIGLAVVLAVGWLAGQVRFQLQTVVVFLGWGALAVVAVRLSLWPAFAMAERRSPMAAVRRSWTMTRGSTTRLLASASAVLSVVAVTGTVGRWLMTWLLTQLSDAGMIVLSPLAIDLWSLLPLPIAAALGVAVWGHAAPSLAQALERWSPPERSDADQRRSGG